MPISQNTIQPYHVYLDLDVLNNDFSSGASAHRLEFSETRNTPFLDGDSSNYVCSIVRFSIQAGSSLPVLIPRIASPEVNKNETIHKVTLSYGGVDFTAPVIYDPGDAATLLLSTGQPVDQSLGSDYYHVKNYRDFIDMVNYAFSRAFALLIKQFPAVTVSFQPF